MHTIEDYSFGCIVIDGTTYRSDVILFPDSIVPDWWREEGHIISEHDLNLMLEARPEAIIIGSGATGLVSVPGKVRAMAAEAGVELHVKPTPGAVELYRELAPKTRIVAGFHLTC